MAVTRRTALALALAWMLPAADRKQKKGPAAKPGPPLQMVGLEIQRVPEDHTIAVEGAVRNIGDRPLHNIILVFHVVAPNGEEVSRQRGQVPNDPFEPGEEYEFHWQMRDSARAVEIRVRALDRQGHIIDVANPGPYTIE